MSTRSPGRHEADVDHDGDAGDLVFATHDLGRDDVAQDGEPLGDNAFVVMDGADQDAIVECIDAVVVAGNGPPATGDAPPVPDLKSFLVTTVTPAQPASPTPFHVSAASSGAPAAAAADPLPWTVRADVPAPPAVELPVASRYSGALERTAEDAVRRLRQEAVDISWSAAWLAATSSTATRRR